MKFLYFFKLILCFNIICISTSSFSIENLDEKVKKLTLELRCMTCQNQSVYDSDSDFAKEIKNLADEKFKEGLNEREIKDFLVKRYGEYILFKPYFNTKNLLLWLFPFILLFGSIFVFTKKLKKNKT